MKIFTKILLIHPFIHLQPLHLDLGRWGSNLSRDTPTSIAPVTSSSSSSGPSGCSQASRDPGTFSESAPSGTGLEHLSRETSRTLTDSAQSRGTVDLLQSILGVTKLFTLSLRVRQPTEEAHCSCLYLRFQFSSSSLPEAHDRSRGWECRLTSELRHSPFCLAPLTQRWVCRTDIALYLSLSSD